MTTEEGAADRLERALAGLEEKKLEAQQLTPEQKERMHVLLLRTAQLPPRDRKRVFEEAGLPFLASQVGLASGRRPAPLPETRVMGSGSTALITTPKPPMQPIDWAMWASIPVLPLWMAVALSLGVNPGPLRHNEYSKVVRFRERAARTFGDQFAARLDVAIANLNASGPLVSVRPFSSVDSALVTMNGFLQFARSLPKPWTLPEEFPGRATELISVVALEPSTPRETGAATPDRTEPVQRQAAQEEAILAKLRELGFDPAALPYRRGKTSEAKMAASKALGFTKDVMKKAWQRLLDDGKIKYASTLGHRPGPNWPKA